MNAGDLVVVHCGSPKEKFWGELLSLTPVGVTLRALPLEAFDDFLRQCAPGAQKLLGAVTLFLPAHRIERIELDESAGVAEGLAARLRRVTGRDPREALATEGRVAGEEPPHN